MDDTDKPKPRRKKNKKPERWVLFIIPFTFLLSGALSLFAETTLLSAGGVGSFLIWVMFIFVGILFDIVGMAVTAADETPFIAMASKKVKGAQHAVWLIKHSDKVASICNDVVGDICSIVGGAAGVAMAARVVAGGDAVAAVLVSALTASLTVGGKAFGKRIAIHRSRDMVFICGYLMASFSGRKKRK